MEPRFIHTVALWGLAYSSAGSRNAKSQEGLRQKEFPPQRFDQFQWEEVILCRPWKHPGLLPDTLDSRSIGRKNRADPRLILVLGISWSC